MLKENLFFIMYMYLISKYVCNTWNQNQTKVKKTQSNARNDNNRLFNEMGIFLLKYFVHIQVQVLLYYRIGYGLFLDPSFAGKEVQHNREVRNYRMDYIQSYKSWDNKLKQIHKIKFFSKWLQNGKLLNFLSVIYQIEFTLIVCIEFDSKFHCFSLLITLVPYDNFSSCYAFSAPKVQCPIWIQQIGFGQYLLKPRFSVPDSE